MGHWEAELGKTTFRQYPNVGRNICDKLLTATTSTVLITKHWAVQRFTLHNHGPPSGIWHVFFFQLFWQLRLNSSVHSRLSVREHFSSPLLQFAEKDDSEGSTFTLVECPSLDFFYNTLSYRVTEMCIAGGTGQLISCLTNNEIDIAMYVSYNMCCHPIRLTRSQVLWLMHWSLA